MIGKQNGFACHYLLQGYRSYLKKIDTRVMNETSYIFPELQSGHLLRKQFGSGLQDKSNLLQSAYYV